MVRNDPDVDSSFFNQELRSIVREMLSIHGDVEFFISKILKSAVRLNFYRYEVK